MRAQTSTKVIFERSDLQQMFFERADFRVFLADVARRVQEESRNGPSQGMMERYGEAYTDVNFPLLSYFTGAEFVDE